MCAPRVFRAPQGPAARWAGLLGVPVGGGPPAHRPRRELRSARRLEAQPGPTATSLISHVIPLWLIQTSNLYRWNCNVFGASRKKTALNDVRHLAARGVVAAHGYRVWLLQARWPGGLKPVSPLLAQAEPQMKPPSPVRVRNGRFGAFFGRRGDVGFNACCSGARSGDGSFTLACVSGRRGDVGFNVATWLCHAREKVHPALVFDAARRTRLAVVGVLQH